MDNPNYHRYYRRRKLLRTVFGVFSLSGILFAFQACYGTPKDFGLDVVIKGRVTSASTKTVLPGIRVDVGLNGQYTLTGSDGMFLMYCEKMREYHLTFSDPKTPRDTRYASRDTIIRPSLTEDSQTVLNLDIQLQ